MAGQRTQTRRGQTAPAQNGNRILASLGRTDLARLQGDLTAVDLVQKETIWEPNQPIEKIFFPLDGVVSILAVTDAGPVEVGTVGNEGVVGLPVFLGARSYAGRAIVQVPGRAERMEVPTFLREARKEGRLREVLQRYTLAFMTQVAQGTACNRAHSAQQRMARWLLVVRDRMGRTEFPLTQEFMGQMLGVRRATVSETAAELHSRGLISYRRGVIVIEDESGLEAAACECYRIVRNEFERLLGTPPG